MTINRKRLITKFLSHVVLALGAVTMIFPFYWMLKTSFLTDSQALEMPPKLLLQFPLYFGNYKELGFTYQEFGWKFLIFSFLISSYSLSTILQSYRIC